MSPCPISKRRTHRSEWKRALPLGFLLFLACASVLGIEDRKLDTAESFPALGYDGCRPGTTCDGCLDVHRDECTSRALCANPASMGECATCVCEACGEPIVDCQLDAGCSAIWQCLEDTRCDLADGATGSCVQACRSVIGANGGRSGAAFQSAVAVRTCAVASSCLRCLPTAPPPAAGCSPQNGCTDCDDCFKQCLCSGDRFSACQDLCGSDAPPEACSEADACTGCSSCFDVCACQGGDFDECTAQCRVDTPCTLATSCADCGGDCVAECRCNGGREIACQSECTAPPAPGECTQQSRGQAGELCGGCHSCLASCTCSAKALVDCMSDCSLQACCRDGSCSPSTLTECTCSNESADKCAEDTYGKCDDVVRGCESCPCNSCHGTYALCQETYGCPDIFECMRSTGCHGGTCFERCGAGDAKVQAAEAFGVAEALWACSQGAGCSCTDPNPTTIACDQTECSAYVRAGDTLDACCVTTAVGAVGASNACGLILDRYFPMASGCIPLGQQNAPRLVLLEPCPSLTGPTGFPYNGAALKGCCRAADAQCGYFDDITGLGCLDAGTFGVTPKSCR